jgi:hypothetical protein
VGENAAPMVAVDRLDDHRKTNFLGCLPGIFGAANRSTLRHWDAALFKEPAGQFLIAGNALCNGAGTVGFGCPDSPLSGAITQLHEVAPVQSDCWNVAIIGGIDNRGGAAGNIGAEQAARAAPDGYTLMQAGMPLAANMSLYKNLSYELSRDFTAVSQLVQSPNMLVVHPSLPTKSVKEPTSTYTWAIQ